MDEDQNYLSLLRYALNLIAKKRYTQAEMQKKLEQFFKKTSTGGGLSEDETIGAEIVKPVIDRLKELKYLDDERYALDYISNRAKFRQRGMYLMKRELQRKGVKKENIDLAFDLAVNSGELDEVKMAGQLLEKKMKSFDKFDPRKRKEKCFVFLSGKGFKPDTIYKAVKQCYDPSVIEDL